MPVRRIAATVAAVFIAMSSLAWVGSTASAEEVGPEVDSCLALPMEGAWSPYGPIEVVDCDSAHNAEVFAQAVYPEDLGAPSKVADRAWELFGSSCSNDNYREWLGAGKAGLPIQGITIPRLPTDEQWETGARWVACSVIRAGSDGNVMTYQGTMPALYATGPVLSWLMCVNGTPKSGTWNQPGSCTAKAKWLVLPGGQVKGKIGKTYPKDLQSKADAMCAKNAKPFLKKGAKSKAVAGLGPKADFPDGDPFSDCFIVKADWNGKTS